MELWTGGSIWAEPPPGQTMRSVTGLETFLRQSLVVLHSDHDRAVETVQP